MKPEIPECVVDMEQKLRQIARTVRRRGRTLLEQYGITPPQFDALLILHKEGELTIGDLSNRLFLAYSTTTDLVDRLVAAGFVVRQRSQDDRRVVHVKMLPAGAHLIEEVLDARRAYLDAVLESLSLDEKKEILHALELLTAMMG
ncbi:MarR family winged helix-turn-helix transcriptional regulator [Alicyclobacillus sp. SO9]|uniref:MarR family winged helix-turn-helix transcriptional regulator n=1 Tax=Alicyclobacillus sp. SO9 TaxID=2665646 RepID=UPI0018E804FB|nr:MarR family transcriptional regulator [Alicyclobacillus sp. SO9]QQE77034.1 MarR family transcriptional regulator [Alicyclobacillus sp. SO9]